MKTPQENQNHSQQNNHEQDGILSENLPFDSAVKSADKNIQERIEELKKGCGKQVDFYQFVCGDNLGTGEYNENGEELYTQNFLCRQCRTELKGIQETLAFVREENKDKITIPISYAKNIFKVLENSVGMGFEIVSQDIKNIVSKEAYAKLTEIMFKYHNANCGPFNRTLKRLIEEKEIELKSKFEEK